MRKSGDVLLISCYELGHQPLALASPLAFLLEAGFHPAALDLAVEELDEARLRQARLIAISVPMHTALRLGMRVAERARAVNPTAELCFYGHYALMNAERLLERLASSVMGGESEAALVRLAQALESGRPGPIPGVIRAGAPPRPALERLRFPVPRREALPALERYAALLRPAGGASASETRITAGYTETSRGCLHHCRHCPIVPVYNGRIFVVPREVVLADIRSQVAAGAGHITFGDPDFLNAPGHALPILRALHDEHPGVTFDITAKVEHLRRERARLPELTALGCAFVVSALESLEDAVLEKLAKRHTRRDIDELLGLMDRAGLVLRPSFVPFTPWSSLAGYLDLLDWIERHGLVEHIDAIQLAIRLLVPPGSRLLEIPPSPGWPGALDEDALTYRWTHAQDPRLDTLQRAVAARVEHGARSAEPARQTFGAIRELAFDASEDAGMARPIEPLLGPRRDHPPRLAEAWFC